MRIDSKWNELVYVFTHLNKKDDPFRVVMTGVTYEDKTYSITRNDCETISFEYIVSGKGTLTIEGESFELKKNDVYILPPHTSYAYASDPDDPWVKSWIVFEGRLAESIFDSYVPKKLYRIENFDISDKLENILKIADDPNVDYCDKLPEFIFCVVDIAMAINRRFSARKLTLADMVENYINANIEEKLSLSGMSKTLNYSKNRIISAFKERHGVTPYVFYDEKRIEIAKNYLTQTNLTISQIAEKLSFADRNYFSSVFKKSTGISPAEYRKNRV